MAAIRNCVSIYSNLLSNCSNDRFGIKALLSAIGTTIIAERSVCKVVDWSCQKKLPACI